ACAPLVVEAAHRVAVAVEQYGRTRRVLDALGGQDRPEARHWIRMDGRTEAEALHPGADGAVEVAVQLGLAPLLLSGGGDGDEPGEQGLEAGVFRIVAVEKAPGARDRALAAGHLDPRPLWCRAA